MAGFLVAASPIFDPTAEPTKAPKTPAIFDSVSESVTEAPATPPMIAPATAPVSPSPDNMTRSMETTVAKITVCILWASERSTTSGRNELYEQPIMNMTKMMLIIFLDVVIIFYLLFKIFFKLICNQIISLTFIKTIKELYLVYRIIK